MPSNKFERELFELINQLIDYYMILKIKLENMFWYGFFTFLYVTFACEENQLFDLFLVCFSQLHRFSKDVFEMVLMKPIKLPIDHKKYQEIGSFWVLPKNSFAVVRIANIFWLAFRATNDSFWHCGYRFDWYVVFVRRVLPFYHIYIA